ARGLGLAELRRHRHRRRPDGEARAQQRHRGLAHRPELVPHEVAAEANRRRRGVRADRGVHHEEPPQGREQEQGRREGVETAMETGAVEVVLVVYAALALGLLYAGQPPTGAEAAIRAEMTARKLGIALLVCAGLATLMSVELWKPDGIVGFLE